MRFWYWLLKLWREQVRLWTTCVAYHSEARGIFYSYYLFLGLDDRIILYLALSIWKYWLNLLALISRRLIIFVSIFIQMLFFIKLYFLRRTLLFSHMWAIEVLHFPREIVIFLLVYLPRLLYGRIQLYWFNWRTLWSVGLWGQTLNFLYYW